MTSPTPKCRSGNGKGALPEVIGTVGEALLLLKRNIQCSIRRRIPQNELSRPCLKCCCREQIRLHLAQNGDCFGRHVARPTHRSRADGDGRRRPMLECCNLQVLKTLESFPIITEEVRNSWCQEIQNELMGLEALSGSPCADDPTFCIQLLLKKHPPGAYLHAYCTQCQISSVNLHLRAPVVQRNPGSASHPAQHASRSR
jgi:hypothetical protein